MNAEITGRGMAQEVKVTALGKNTPVNMLGTLPRLTDLIRAHISCILDETQWVEQAANTLLGERAEKDSVLGNPPMTPTQFGGQYGELETVVQALEAAVERLVVANRRLRQAT